MAVSDKDWLTLGEVQAMIDPHAPVSLKTLRRWCESGFIPSDQCYRNPVPARSRWYVRSDAMAGLLKQLGVWSE